jgi:hypothetical protein
MRVVNIALQIGTGASAAVAGALHAYLYADGYRDIPTVGPAFLIQGSVLCALAVLILVGGPRWLSLCAATVVPGSLVAFAMSRTVGLFGFIETGWQPSPYAALSTIAEALVIGLVAVSFMHRRLRSPDAGAANEPIADPANERIY